MQCVAVFCGVLQRATVCYSMLQSVAHPSYTDILSRTLHCVAVCCGVLRCVAVCSTSIIYRHFFHLRCVAVCCSVLQCAAVCCSVLQCAPVCCRVEHIHHIQIFFHIHCAAVCCSVLRCVAVCSTSIIYRHSSTYTVLPYAATCYSVLQYPVTEETTLEIFASPDYQIFLDFLLSHRDSVYSEENLFENLGTPEKTCLIRMGTPVKTCWKFCQS